MAILFVDGHNLLELKTHQSCRMAYMIASGVD